MPIISGGVVIEGAARGTRRTKFTYDFAVHGGAVGTIAVAASDPIPSGAIVVDAFLNVLTVPTSGGAATIALGVQAAGDLLAAAAIAGAPWSTTGLKSLTPAFTGATAIALTAARSLIVTVATAALTAGKFDVQVLWIEP